MKKRILTAGLVLTAVIMSGCGNTAKKATEAQTTETATEAQTTETATEAQTTEKVTEAQTTEAATEAQTTETATEAQTTEAVTEAQTKETVTEAQTTETVTEVQTTEAAKTQATEAAKVQTTEAATKTQTAKQVTEEQAVETALKDAGVTEAEITNLRVKKEIDDGVEEYNVDFYVENKEYEYEINASTGEIRSRDMEIDDDFVDSSEKSSALTEAEILKILQEKVPEVQEKDVRMKLEKERSGLVYEGEINMGFAKGEYEFEIDALTGQIIKWEEE